MHPRRRLLALATLAALTGGAWAQPAPSPEAAGTPRAEIVRQRQAIAAELAQQEAACHQRFAVDNCLRKARSSARERDNLLWRQELELDEAERRARAAQRLQAIEERGGSAQPSPPAAQQSAQHPRDTQGDAAERERQARERAEQTRQRQAAHAAEQQRRAQEQAERLEQSRQRYEARQQKAQERREQRERERAQEAADGRVPARPLPEPE